MLLWVQPGPPTTGGTPVWQQLPDKRPEFGFQHRDRGRAGSQVAQGTVSPAQSSAARGERLSAHGRCHY